MAPGKEGIMLDPHLMYSPDKNTCTWSIDPETLTPAEKSEISAVIFRFTFRASDKVHILLLKCLNRLLQLTLLESFLYQILSFETILTSSITKGFGEDLTQVVQTEVNKHII